MEHEGWKILRNLEKPEMNGCIDSSRRSAQLAKGKHVNLVIYFYSCVMPKPFNNANFMFYLVVACLQAKRHERKFKDQRA
jgi:hypothetical protein